jgi:hypothetical protein
MATVAERNFGLEGGYRERAIANVTPLRRAGRIVLIEFMKPDRAENLVEALVASRMILFAKPLIIASRITRDNNEPPRRDAARATVVGLQAAALKATSHWSDVTAILPRSMNFDTSQRPGSANYRSVVDFKDKWVDEEEIARSRRDYEAAKYLEPILTSYDAPNLSAGVSSLATDSGSPDLLIATNEVDLGNVRNFVHKIDGISDAEQMDGSLILSYGRNVANTAALSA